MKSTAHLLLAALLVGLTGCAVPSAQHFPDMTSLPAQSTMPDPLILLDGRRVGSAAQWRSERRPELEALFQHYMYGNIPKRVPVKAVMRSVHRDFLDGKATLKLIALETGSGGPVIDLLLVTPNGRRGPAPVFLAMNFCGNHAALDDPKIHLNTNWVYANQPGVKKNRATEASRGKQKDVWNVEDIIERGYAIALFYSSDIDPDRANYNWNISYRSSPKTLPLRRTVETSVGVGEAVGGPVDTDSLRELTRGLARLVGRNTVAAANKAVVDFDRRPAGECRRVDVQLGDAADDRAHL